MKNLNQFPLLIFCYCSFIAYNTAISQNLEKVVSKEAVKVSGGLNYNSIFYNTNNALSRREPYTWFFSGNVNVSILDVSLPFTYSYSNQQGTYTQPFNQFSLQPYYKWVKSYLGYSSMNFSNYTLAGHVFFGAGVELTPGKWKAAIMFGKLKEAVEYDALNNSDANMAYKRWGGGFKVGYDNGNQGVDLILFKARDDEQSLTFVPSAAQIKPQENTVISLRGKTSITKWFTAEAEYALSGFTSNFNNELPTSSTQTNYLPFLFNPKANSQFFKAFKTSIGLNRETFSFQMIYERIDPDYKTLGAYFFNNDMENITIAPSVRIFNGKTILSANTGFQRNNLDDSKLATTNRLVGSFNITAAVSSKLNLSGSYSNFSSYTKNRPLNDPYYVASPADTLQFYQISQSASGTINYLLGGDRIKKTFMFMLSTQTVGGKSGSTLTPGANINTASANYNMLFTDQKLTLALLANANNTITQSIETRYFGPGASLSKSFYNNALRSTLGYTYNMQQTAGNTTGSVNAIRFNLQFNPKLKNQKLGKPSASLSCTYLTKNNTGQTSNSEFTGMVNLTYAFQ